MRRSIRFADVLFVLPLVAATVILWAAPAQATDGTWIADDNGVWSNSTKWSGGNIADGAGSTADFTTVNLTGYRAVTIDGAVLSPTVGILDIGQPLDDRGYYFKPINNGKLTFDNGGSPAEINNLNTTTGSGGNTRPRFDLPIILDSDLNINNMGTSNNPSNPLQLKTNEIWFNGQGLEGAATTGNTVYLANVSTGTAVIWASFGNGKLNDGPNGGKLGVIQDGNNALWLASNPVGNYSGGTFIKKGLLIVSQNNPGTGAVYLGAVGGNDAGFLMTGNNKNVTISSPINLTAGATGTLTVGGGNGYIATFSGPINLNGANLTLAPDKATSTVRLTGAITGAGTLNGAGDGVAEVQSAIPASVTGITQNSANSTLALSGANAYAGLHTITAGALSFVKKQAISGGVPSLIPANVSVAPGATLGLGVGASPTYFDSADVNAVIAQMGLAGSNIGLDTTAGNFTHAGAIAGGLGVAKLGSNTLTLSGANTYAGPTTVSKGTLAISAANSLPAAPTVNIGAAGTLSSNAAGVTITGGTVNVTAGGTLSTAAPGTLTINGGTLTGDLNTAGDGLLTIANVTYGGNVTNTGNVTFSGSTLTGNHTTKGPGTLTIDNSTSSGSMYVHSGGSLVISGGSQVGSPTADAHVGYWGQGNDCSATVTGSGTVWNSGKTSYFFGDASSNNSILITDGAKIISHPNDVGHGINVGSRNGKNNTMTIQNGGSWDLTGGANDSLYVGNQWGGDAVQNNLLEVHSGGSLVNLTSVYIAIDGKYRTDGTANGFDNKLNVYGAGVMEFVTATPTVLINTVGTGNAINMLSGATLSYKGVTGVDMNANTVASGVGLFTWAGNNTLRLDNSSSATASYTLTNTGAATTYSTLHLINGGSTSGVITVGAGGTLSGTGTSATTILNAGGTLSPGLSIGTLNGTDFTWNDGSMAFELSDTDNASDLLNLSGAFTKGSGSFLFDFTGGVENQIYTLVNFGTTSFAQSDFGIASGIAGTFILNSDNLQFNTSPAMTVIPEPATIAVWSLLGLLALGWCAWRRRR